ncbi:hypothetical protein INR49_000317 [Caranx melampygus]|nr:hypothetical protein INR49_000317 [Caranx melampygus]
MGEWSHTSPQEGDVVQVAETNRNPSVKAEGLDRAEGRTAAQEESESVSQGGDGDGDGSIPVGASEPVGDAVQNTGPLPTGDHDEHIIKSNTCRCELLFDIVGHPVCEKIKPTPQTCGENYGGEQEPPRMGSNKTAQHLEADPQASLQALVNLGYVTRRRLAGSNTKSRLSSEQLATRFIKNK